MVKPDFDSLLFFDVPLRFCTDEQSQKQRTIASMLAEENDSAGHDLPWTVAALEAENGDLGKARIWLGNWAPTRAETR